MKNPTLLIFFLSFMLSQNTNAQKTDELRNKLIIASESILKTLSTCDSSFAMPYYLNDQALDSMIFKIGTAKSDSEKVAIRKHLTRQREQFLPSIKNTASGPNGQKLTILYLNCDYAEVETAGSLKTYKVTIHAKFNELPMTLTMTGLSTGRTWHMMGKVKRR